jgi:uncharacterized protein YegP (UPF0339 family)
MGLFEIIKRPNGEFQFMLKATGNDLLLSSEGYRTKDSCRKGIESVRRNSVDRSKFDVLSSKSGRTYFTIRSANGRVIGTSEVYGDNQAREDAIKAVRRLAPQARVTDLTARRYPQYAY